MWCKRLGVAAVAASLLAPALARAWGPEGHTIIARVAYAQLTGQAKADFDWIIQTGVPALNAATTRCQIDPTDPFGTVDPSDDSSTNLANWADCYRNSHAETAPWHFDDIPLATTLDPASDTLGLLAANPTWCVSGCVSQAVADNLRALAQPNPAPADAARALAFVVHFIGDMHQPLHVEDNNDRGGNDVTVDVRGVLDASRGRPSKKLHATWDSDLVANAMGDDLDEATQQLTNDVAMVDPALTEGTATVEDVIASSDKWVAAGHDLAAEAYSNLTPPAPLQTPPFDTTKPARLHSQLTAAYVTSEDPVIEQQLTAATVRVGAALTAALTWMPPQ